MIVVNLKGGLGNQMFQYACARAVCLRAKARGEECALKLDASGYARQGGNTPRTFDLEAFDVLADIASPEEVRRAKYPFGPLSKAYRLFKAKVLRIYHVAYDPKVAAVRDGAYLDGYFQSERYFSDFAADIRRDFALKKPLSGPALDLFEKISRDPYAVSVHIRRGDYVSDKAASKHHGACGVEYYERAVALIAQRIGKPSLYVFSDDIEWAKESLSFSCPVTFVSGPDVPYVVEPTLMAACRHNIIANSTFGWWGAWLNGNPDKVVIAPKRWSNEHNDDWYRDIVPESWIRI